jgi:hypothetical protein
MVTVSSGRALPTQSLRLAAANAARLFAQFFKEHLESCIAASCGVARFAMVSRRRSPFLAEDFP